MINMNVLKSEILIDVLNENNIVDIELYYVFGHNEEYFYDDHDELKRHMKNNNIAIKENNYEYTFYYEIHNYFFNNSTSLKELLIDEFEDINLKNYNVADIEINNDSTYNLIVEIFNITYELDEIIKNILQQ
jgi:hypothetical protein